MFANTLYFFSLGYLYLIYDIVDQTLVTSCVFSSLMLIILESDSHNVLSIFQDSFSSEDKLVLPDESAL